MGIVDFLQGTDSKYALVIGTPIGIVDFLQGTDGKYAIGAFSSYCIFFSLHSPFFAHAHPVPSRWSADSREPGAGVSPGEGILSPTVRATRRTG